MDSLKFKTRGTIWHTEDHHPRTAICFCPTLYHRTLEGTFGNPQVFQEVPRTFQTHVKKVQKAAKRDLQRRYPWAFRRTPVIPRAYALPKRKKEFASGRPIVSFVDAFMRPLLEATSHFSTGYAASPSPRPSPREMSTNFCARSVTFSNLAPPSHYTAVIRTLPDSLTPFPNTTRLANHC